MQPVQQPNVRLVHGMGNRKHSLILLCGKIQQKKDLRHAHHKFPVRYSVWYHVLILRPTPLIGQHRSGPALQMGQIQIFCAHSNHLRIFRRRLG